MKNSIIWKDTGEKKEIERKEDLPSFFHFFTNLKTPCEEEIKNVKLDIERELGGHFDMEYELGLEFIEEIIPYASEFFAGVARDEDEYHEYLMEQRENKFWILINKIKDWIWIIVSQWNSYNYLCKNFRILLKFIEVFIKANIIIMFIKYDW